MTQQVDEIIRSVAISDIDLRYSKLRLLCPVQVARLHRQVELDGIQHPVLVSDGIEDGRLVLVDGFKRVEVSRKLGENAVLVRVVKLAPVSAEVAIISSNAAQRGLSDMEEGLIVQSLYRTHGQTQVEIAQLLGHHKSWVCRRLRLIERLDPSVQTDVRLGLTSASVAREVVRLPRGNQGATAKAIATHGLSSRQAARLVSVLLVADSSSHQAILRAPLEHLPSDRSAERYSPDPRLGASGNQLRQYMLRLGATSHRLIELFRNHGPTKFADIEAGILKGLADRILPASKKAIAQLDTLTHLDPGDEK